MLRIVFIMILFLSFNCQGQDYARVDQLIKKYPARFISIDALVSKIDKDFTVEEEKVRAIYGWLAMNINYESRSNRVHTFDISEHRIFYFSVSDKEFQLKRKKLKKLKQTLTTKRATCTDYSNLFKELCDRMGIEAALISGYSKVNLTYFDTNSHFKNHAWNAVKIKDTWHLLDVTWGASTLGTPFVKNYDYYFFTNPKELNLTHFPIDSSWQLQEDTISKELFFNTPLFYSNYFIDKFKIAQFQDGIVKVANNTLKIYFNSVPKNKKISYRLAGDTYTKPIRFKKTESGHLIGSIKYSKYANSNLTIYANRLPVLGFRINRESKN